MTTDIQYEVTAWVADETGRQAFGEDFGFTVFCGVVAMPNGAGGVSPVPVWHLLLTARNPIVGEGPLYHLTPLGDPMKIHLGIRPAEDAVRAKVTEGLRMLRELAASKLAPANGGTPPRGRK